MSSRDNWERLVAAVLKREQIWQLCHDQSRSPSISTISSDFSEQVLNFSSNSLEPISVSPPPQFPLSKPSVSREAKKFLLTIFAPLGLIGFWKTKENNGSWKFLFFVFHIQAASVFWVVILYALCMP